VWVPVTGSKETIEWAGKALLLRPIRPEDAVQHQAFFKALDPGDVRLRVFHSMPVLDNAQVARLTQIDYDREMAFIAVCFDGSADAEIAAGIVAAQLTGGPLGSSHVSNSTPASTGTAHGSS